MEIFYSYYKVHNDINTGVKNTFPAAEKITSKTIRFDESFKSSMLCLPSYSGMC